MFKTFLNAIKVKGIRDKILFTLGILLIARLGSYIPVPGVNPSVITNAVGTNGVLSIIDAFSGGSLSRFTIFALSIIPYINASIIMTLLTASFDKLKVMAKEDQKKVQRITRYLTIGLAIVQAIGYTAYISFSNAFTTTSPLNWVISIIVLTAGACILLWLGEQINERGIGNGISLIIFIGIVSRIPGMISLIYNKVIAGETPNYMAFLLLAVVLVAIVGIVIITQAERRIPIHYSKKVVGRRMTGGQSTFIPMKINQAGVIPIIFASSILILPGTIITLFFRGTPADAFYTSWLGVNTPIYIAVNMLLIVLFTFFYSVISFNPADVAENLKNNGGYIPGIRPGKPTAETLQKILFRITIFGGIFLAVVATLPAIVGGMVDTQTLFGGTSLLIAVGVAIDTMKQIESQLLMRSYQGFLK